MSTPLDKQVEQHPFHLDSLSELMLVKTEKKKKKSIAELVAVEGCMLVAFIHDIFDVSLMEVKILLYLKGYFLVCFIV